jgi:chromosome segregation ATPase
MRLKFTQDLDRDLEQPFWMAKRQRVPLGRQLSLASQDADDHLSSMQAHLAELQGQIASDSKQIRNSDLNAQQLRQMQSTLKGRQTILGSWMEAIDLVDDCKDSLHSGRETAEATYKSLKNEGSSLKKSLAKLLQETVDKQKKASTRTHNDRDDSGMCEDLHKQTMDLLRGIRANPATAAVLKKSDKAVRPRAPPKKTARKKRTPSSSLPQPQVNNKRRQSARIATRSATHK